MIFMNVSSVDDWRQLHGLFMYCCKSESAAKVVQPQHSLIPTGGTLCPCGSWDGTPRHHLTVGWSSPVGHPGWPELLYSGGKHMQSTDTPPTSGNLHVQTKARRIMLPREYWLFYSVYHVQLWRDRDIGPRSVLASAGRIASFPGWEYGASVLAWQTNRSITLDQVLCEIDSIQTHPSMVWSPFVSKFQSF